MLAFGFYSICEGRWNLESSFGKASWRELESVCVSNRIKMCSFLESWSPQTLSDQGLVQFQLMGRIQRDMTKRHTSGCSGFDLAGLWGIWCNEIVSILQGNLHIEVLCSIEYPSLLTYVASLIYKTHGKSPSLRWRRSFRCTVWL